MLVVYEVRVPFEELFVIVETFVTNEISTDFLEEMDVSGAEVALKSMSTWFHSLLSNLPGEIVKATIISRINTVDRAADLTLDINSTILLLVLRPLLDILNTAISDIMTTWQSARYFIFRIEIFFAVETFEIVGLEISSFHRGAGDGGWGCRVSHS